MKAVIIYNSKYGATRQYAEWMGEELELPVVTPDRVTAQGLLRFDFVIIGSSVYMGNPVAHKKQSRGVRNPGRS